MKFNAKLIAVALAIVGTAIPKIAEPHPVQLRGFEHVRQCHSQEIACVTFCEREHGVTGELVEREGNKYILGQPSRYSVLQDIQMECLACCTRR